MDSGEFLDILGNANRRRILELLSQKPCYVTEISEYLSVSPKAVIDHLEQLEDAGLVESRTDERRRKYFSITRHVRLEVSVSPYEFGTRSAYPPNNRFDVTSLRRLEIQLDEADDRADRGAHPRGSGTETGEAPSATPHSSRPGEPPEGDAVSTDTNSSESVDAANDTGWEPPEPQTLAHRLRNVQQLERELSLVHRWADSRITELREDLAESVGIGEPRLVSEVLVALADDPMETATLARQLDVPAGVIEDLLDILADQGVVSRSGRKWELVE